MFKNKAKEKIKELERLVKLKDMRIEQLERMAKLKDERIEQLIEKNDRLQDDCCELANELDEQNRENDRLRSQLVLARQESKTFKRKYEMLTNTKVNVICVSETKK